MSSTSVLLEWTYDIQPTPTNIDRYIVYYESHGDSHSVSFWTPFETVKMLLLTNLPPGGIHNISLVAVVYLPSYVVGPVTPGLLLL